MPPEIHIASAIIYTLPSHVDAVATLLARMPPIQLHGRSSAGKLVVTLEGGTSGEILDQVGAIQQLDQVINVALVFQAIEPDEEASGEASNETRDKASNETGDQAARTPCASRSPPVTPALQAAPQP
ncbi:periplasmic nitrate reductase chaperone NapD [Roseateles sp. YR242]|nr:periplasmic nitrate reductase chaperone NapD [Roseateles sp. YR242]